MDERALEAAGMAIYAAFIREADPKRVEYRWGRMSPESRDRWIREARAAIETYHYVTTGERM